MGNVTDSTRRTLLYGLLTVLLVLLLFFRFRSDATVPAMHDSGVQAATHRDAQAQEHQSAQSLSAVPSPSADPAMGVVFSGRAPVPTGGALVAPLEIAWRLVKEPGDSAAFSGSITVTNRGRSGELQLTVQPRGALRLSSSGHRQVPEAQAGAAIELPVAGTLGSEGKRGALYVDATITVFGLQLPRDLTIEFDPRPAGDVGPPAGSRIIVDDQGQRLILQPGVP